MALLGCAAEPTHGLLMVLLYTLPLIVQNTQMVLGAHVALLCRHVVPLGRFVKVLLFALAVFMQNAQIELRLAVALLGGPAIPVRGFLHAGFNPAACVVKQPQAVLCVY